MAMMTISDGDDDGDDDDNDGDNIIHIDDLYPPTLPPKSLQFKQMSPANKQNSFGRGGVAVVEATVE